MMVSTAIGKNVKKNVELSLKERYRECKNRRRELLTSIETLITPEAQLLVDECFEVTAYIQSYEYNMAFLCGVTLLTDINKRFESLTPEFKSYSTEFFK